MSAQSRKNIWRESAVPIVVVAVRSLVVPDDGHPRARRCCHGHAVHVRVAAVVVAVVVVVVVVVVVTRR